MPSTERVHAGGTCLSRWVLFLSVSHATPVPLLAFYHHMPLALLPNCCAVPKSAG